MCFDVDVEGARGEAVIRCSFATGPGVMVLLGPSGVGKTSVLHMIAGLLRPARGHVRVGGVTLFGDEVDVPVERRRAGYVFQDARLFPHLRVRANLLYGAGRLSGDDRAKFVGPSAFGQRQGGPSPSSGRTEGEPEGEGQNTLAGVTRLLDIGPLLDRWPRTLSGGEVRRVAIGRALLSDPAFLLLDEPLASLDPVRREDGLRLVERLRDTGLPVLMVTHDEREADRLADTVVRMG